MIDPKKYEAILAALRVLEAALQDKFPENGEASIDVRPSRGEDYLTQGIDDESVIMAEGTITVAEWLADDSR